MPGLRRSIGLADFGADSNGYDALEKAFEHVNLNPSGGQPAASVHQRCSSQPAPRPVPTTYADIPSDDDDNAESESEVHAGFENRIASPSRAIDLDGSGLPPTPTKTNSEGADAQRDPDLSPPPLFADGVRNALESKHSRLSVTPVQQLSPPTPDPSPPATNAGEPNVKRKEAAGFGRPAEDRRGSPQLLHPMAATQHNTLAVHRLRPYPSSRAESFQTAREDQPLSETANTSQVHLPEDDTLPRHWLDSTNALRSATIGLGDFSAMETPRDKDAVAQSPSTPVGARRRSKHESPPQTARGDTDWEKHISYVSDPAELDGYSAPVEDKQLVNGLGLFGAGTQHQPMECTVEDVNNMVYKRIREENVRRHSAISANSGAITVGVIVPHSESTPRKLSRKVKRSSLRDDNGSEVTHHGGDGTERTLSHKKVRLPERRKAALEDSPVFESSMRQVSAPARFGTQTSDMTALTFASIQDDSRLAKSMRLPPSNTTADSERQFELLMEREYPDWVSETNEEAEPKRTPKLPPSPPPKRKLGYSSKIPEWVSETNEAGKSKLNPQATAFAPPERNLRYSSKITDWVDAIGGPKPVQPTSPSNHKLRHFSHGDRLSKNMSVRRTSLETSPPLQPGEFRILSEPVYPTRSASGRTSDRVINNMAVKRSSVEGQKVWRPIENPVTLSPASQVGRLHGVIPSVTSDSDGMPSPDFKLRRFSREERLENNSHVRRTSGDYSTQSQLQHIETRDRRFSQDKSVLSSPRKSVDARFLHPTTTPLSTSQFSDRTENIELCEASGVKIYPHNNDSLLVVQHGSRPVSKGRDMDTMLNERPNGIGKPIFAAQIDPPSPILGSSKPHHVDSPLTNPRQAPEPPVIKFIPPTPNAELERELTDDDGRNGVLRVEVNLPERRLTLVQRARRYSDNFFARSGSTRRPKYAQPGSEERSKYLSPLWRPEGFWDGYDSDEDEEDFEAAGTLPKGGDTSDVGEDGERRRGSILPRAMSKRLPGFRGTGGFLVGNSLGLDRHGTNNRRHYVSSASRTLSKQASAELLKSFPSKSNGNGYGASHESLKKVARARSFVLPFSGGRRAQWVGAQRFRARMRAIRLAREEREREKRRQNLRSSIGYRVYHDSAC